MHITTISRFNRGDFQSSSMNFIYFNFKHLSVHAIFLLGPDEFVCTLMGNLLATGILLRTNAVYNYMMI